MNYLLSGGTDFLGRHVLEYLQKKHPEIGIVLLVENLDEWHSSGLGKNFKQAIVLEGRLDRSKDWSDHPSLEHLSGIFHLASDREHSRLNQERVIQTNIEATKSLVELAAQKKVRMIHISAAGTVGCSKDPHQQANESAPYAESVVSSWPYYASKIAAEQQSMLLAESLGVELVTLRLPFLLGPRDHKGTATALVANFIKGHLHLLIPGGIHYLDVRDAAAACVHAMRHPQPRAIYHLPGHSCSIEDFFADIVRISGKVPPYYRLSSRLALRIASWNQKIGRLMGLPGGVSFFPDPVAIEMASHYWGLSSMYSQEDLHFRPRPASDTLRDTLECLKECIRAKRELKRRSHELNPSFALKLTR